ncbi:hypothetical protein l11_06810 [Neisseria weaveri LMG 5135]|nr:hypothetical protein l11_06810 [Neisseria weaveri LMG 5135]
MSLPLFFRRPLALNKVNKTETSWKNPCRPLEYLTFGSNPNSLLFILLQQNKEWIKHD